MAAIQTPTLAHFKLPNIENEPMLNYAPGSTERQKLTEALKEMSAQGAVEVPVVINGEKIYTGNTAEQYNPSSHKTVVCKYHQADKALTQKAIDGALAARARWEALPFNDRVAVFLKAADLLSTKYRFKIMAATMLGQGKNIWQAEIDAAAELCDFWRFNCKYAEELYQQQPPKNAPGNWNRTEFRALEGFVLAVSPFNFTAIGGNLPSAPVLMGNVCLWKPSPSAVYSNYLVYELLVEAGLPAGVIQFIPGPAEEICGTAIDSPDFASLHFTGSTHVFRQLWKQIGNNIEKYKSYPRIVGETGGKNYHLGLPDLDSAGIRHAAIQTIRGAFEFQGQKCSACSRVYFPKSKYDEFKSVLLAEHAKISQGPVEEFKHFMGPVINKFAFDKIKSFIDFAASSDDCKILAGGKYDDSKGYFIEPTIIETTNPFTKTMVEEIFGPVMTLYAYDDNKFEETCKLVGDTTQYALTGAIFGRERANIVEASNLLRNTAGNFYINDKCTGAVVGQQPFGGARASGTNDKAGSFALLGRFLSMRSVKENFVPIDAFIYPSNN
ncbi:1-pyrroline-5-carboxylate dehydrogenase [Radiomyces spectabilis]|uniref:1-pyrroline-5-carboxylate dehydrogenase n=1 Tax=Radiomyces spectabilis TaxID=64574 RepID=UPI00221E7BEE|nr:1-pyrroline-5-carboxylate dehydrogenase [Radiomyces spectabilis]KAI8391050.1 1-pyrroline-5-carboxylate dehydrogenase [Radiomyces spectabilis]